MRRSQSTRDFPVSLRYLRNLPYLKKAKLGFGNDSDGSSRGAGRRCKSVPSHPHQSRRPCLQNPVCDGWRKAQHTLCPTLGLPSTFPFSRPCSAKSGSVAALSLTAPSAPALPRLPQSINTSPAACRASSVVRSRPHRASRLIPATAHFVISRAAGDNLGKNRTSCFPPMSVLLSGSSSGSNNRFVPVGVWLPTTEPSQNIALDRVPTHCFDTEPVHSYFPPRNTFDQPDHRIVLLVRIRVSMHVWQSDRSTRRPHFIFILFSFHLPNVRFSPLQFSTRHPAD